MLRKRLFQKYARGKEDDKKHPQEIFRIEALSDAVFAFSVSLLIISLEVPSTFHDLKKVMDDFLPFFATVALVFFFWYLQNEYFRQYRLNDGFVIVLNLTLLALILFYAFPLKFLFTLLLSWLAGRSFFHPAETETVLTQSEFPQLIIYFSIGYAVIWFIFFLLYRHAQRHSEQLSLSKISQLYLRHQQTDAGVQMLIGTGSVVFALCGWPVISGFCFLLIPLWLLVNYYRFRKQLKRLPS